VKVIVAGGTGFLGRPLCRALAAAGHTVVVLTRGQAIVPGASRTVEWAPERPAGSGPPDPWGREIDGADAVVNLAGAGLADRRWTEARKDVLRSSRILATRNLVAAIRAAKTRPSVFLSGSAVGFYGATGDAVLDESFPPGSDFLATLCVHWEAEAHAAAALGCRVVIVRTGIVLGRDGGALKKLLLPFRLFVGGPIASGQQQMSWIHRDDWVAMIRWALERPSVSGVFNATAPHPVTNREFSQALGRALRRPSWLPVPAFALRLLVGEIADVALVAGQRVAPTHATDAGFTFHYPAIDAAMRAAIRETA
jgi:uncharacterized protein (TIGR01777 family)